MGNSHTHSKARENVPHKMAKSIIINTSHMKCACDVIIMSSGIHESCCCRLYNVWVTMEHVTDLSEQHTCGSRCVPCIQVLFLHRLTKMFDSLSCVMICEYIHCVAMTTSGAWQGHLHDQLIITCLQDLNFFSESLY